MKLTFPVKNPLKRVIESIPIKLLQEFAEVKVILTTHSTHFLDIPTIKSLTTIHVDEDEWKTYQRGDPILHIEV